MLLQDSNDNNLVPKEHLKMTLSVSLKNFLKKLFYQYSYDKVYLRQSELRDVFSTLSGFVIRQGSGDLGRTSM